VTAAGTDPHAHQEFAAGAVTGDVIAQIEDAPISWPSAWLLVRAIAAGSLVLAASSTRS